MSKVGKITDFMINKRYFILGIFLVLAIVCGVLSQKVVINYDIAEYLPDTSETRKGLDIMEDDFEPLKTSTLNLMVKDLDNTQRQEIKKRLETFENVNSVDYEPTEEYQKEDYTLYKIEVNAEEDSEIASQLYHKITEEFDEYEIATSGGISDRNRPVLETWIVFLAVRMCTHYFDYHERILCGTIFVFIYNFNWNFVKQRNQFDICKCIAYYRIHYSHFAIGFVDGLFHYVNDSL